MRVACHCPPGLACRGCADRNLRARTVQGVGSSGCDLVCLQASSTQLVSSFGLCPRPRFSALLGNRGLSICGTVGLSLARLREAVRLILHKLPNSAREEAWCSVVVSVHLKWHWHCRQCRFHWLGRLGDQPTKLKDVQGLAQIFQAFMFEPSRKMS